MRCLALCTAIVTFGCGSIPLPESPAPYELAKEEARGEHEAAIPQFTATIDRAEAENHAFTASHLERGERHLQAALETREPDRREGFASSARVDFQKAMNERELSHAARGRALVGCGQAFRLEGDEKSAEELFRLFLESPPTEESLPLRLKAHRNLGQILMEKSHNAGKESMTVEVELLLQERFRQAQWEFSKGLEIDAEDEGCNLGKGICLHLRRQDREAIGFLRKATRRCEIEGVDCPRGYYFLGRALEINKGHHRQALEYYRKAVEHDTDRSFTPLYAHLTEVLPAYLAFKEPEFSWFFDRLLDYTGNDKSYWTQVERLAGPLAASPDPEHSETGIFALAVARARNDNINEAVKNALQLEGTPDFLSRLGRIFPKNRAHPAYLYGHALTLLEAKKYKELEVFFQEKLLASPPPASLENQYYNRTLVLQGRSLVDRWQESNPAPPLSNPGKLERDRKLEGAREAFQGYLKKYPADPEVIMLLGDVEERMGGYTAAYLSYAQVARGAPYHSEAFRGVARLHAGDLLPPRELAEAWSLLRQYTGNEEEILEYIKGVAHAIRKEALLYCRSCGRKCSEGETSCLECGHQLEASLREKDLTAD